MSKWERVKLSDICDINMGQSPDSATYNTDGNGIPFYQGNADFGELHPVVRHFCNAPTKIANSGDLLLSVRAPIGALNIAAERCCIGRGLSALTPKEQVMQKYVYYVLKKKNAELNAKGTGSTFKAINKQSLSDTLIPVPPIEEQRKIAATLDAVADLLKMRKQQLTELDKLVISQFIEMFGNPVSNPMGWETKPLGESCLITTGNTPPRADIENYGDFIEWIKTDNIEATSQYLTPAKEFLSEKGFLKGRYVEVNSILMTCIAGSLNSIGNVAITNRRVAFNQQINALTPIDYNCIFLYWLLKMSKEMICNSVNMVLKGILSKGRLSEIRTTVPPLPLQTRFAEVVDVADKTKFIIQQSIDQTQALFDSLMSEYFD